MERLSGKIAAVTGGASGIGEATVRRFVAEGAKVAFADRDVDRGKRVAAEIEASGGQALFVEAHMEREAEAAAFVQQAADRFGRLDVLVNNAGIRMYQTVVEASAESWDEILGVNLKGYVFCAKAAIPVIRQGGGGSIVNVASVRSVTTAGKTTQYDTTKAAVAGLTRGMAMDHAPDQIAPSRWVGPSSSTGRTPPRPPCSSVRARPKKSPRASCFSLRTTPPS